jgi:anti-anti-sigma regulatory factor
MNITIEQVQGGVPVTILATHGDLDGSNYQELIDAARQAYQAGAGDLLIDMSDTSFMSSAGLVALHSIALMMNGMQPPDPASGWDALRAIDRDKTSGFQKHVKLLNPQARVDRSLEMTGMKQFFEVFQDRAAAIASFV